MPPDPPSISVPCMLLVLCTITHTITYYTKGHTLTMCLQSGKYTFLDPLVCQICVYFKEDHTTLPPQYSIATRFGSPWPKS